MHAPADTSPSTSRHSRNGMNASLHSTVETGMHSAERSPQLNEGNMSSSQLANASSRSDGDSHALSLSGSDMTEIEIELHKDCLMQGITSTDKRDVIISMISLQGSVHAYTTFHDWVSIPSAEALVLEQEMPSSPTAIAVQKPPESGCYRMSSPSSSQSGSSCSLSSWSLDRTMMTPSTLTNFDADSAISGRSSMTLGLDWAVLQIEIPLVSSIDDLNGIGAWAETQ